MKPETKDETCPYCSHRVEGLLQYFDEGEEREFRCPHCGGLIAGKTDARGNFTLRPVSPTA